MAVNPVPSGLHSITPSVMFNHNAKQALEFYKKAFDAEVLDVYPSLDGKGVMHATLRIGDSRLMMGDVMGPHNSSAESLGSSPITLWIYTEDVDRLFGRAIAAGAVETMAVGDQFWGDRMGQLKDPFGYTWAIATRKYDYDRETVRKKADEFFSGMR